MDALAAGIVGKRVNWVFDADFSDYFSSLSHQWRMKFLEHRIADTRILRLIEKWLAAAFQLLGFTHACGKTRKSGRFKLTRLTDSKRMRAKLLAVKSEMWKRMHLPIPEQGRWLARVLSGHYNYYAVSDNIEALSAFREQIIQRWLKSLRRRSRNTGWTGSGCNVSLINGYLCRAFCIPGRSSASPPSPKAGAQCGSAARWDLRGGAAGNGRPYRDPPTRHGPRPRLLTQRAEPSGSRPTTR